MGAGVAWQARQGMQHQDYVERNGHELVAEEEPGKAVQPLANE